MLGLCLRLMGSFAAFWGRVYVRQGLVGRSLESVSE